MNSSKHSLWSGSQSTFVWILDLPFASGVTLGKFLKFSVFQCPHLSHSNNNNSITERSRVG